MGFHPNDKRSQVIRPKTHTTFLFSYLTKSSIGFILCAVGSGTIRKTRRIYANINSFLLYN